MTLIKTIYYPDLIFILPRVIPYVLDLGTNLSREKPDHLPESRRCNCWSEEPQKIHEAWS